MRALVTITALILWLSHAGLSMAQTTKTDPTPPTPWDVCNETSFVLRFASAFIRDGRVRTEGWTQIQPGACQALQPPQNSPRFLFAETLSFYRGDIRTWGGTIELCAGEDDFSSDATDNCRLNNMDARQYFAVDPAETRTTLIEPNEFKTKAEIAGVQRLMRDAGYNVSRIDGINGRRTLATITQAKADLGLDKTADIQSVIKALISAVKTRQKEVGLEICNDSRQKIYAALAAQSNGDWVSRGWWPIDKEQCIKPHDQSLIGSGLHLFALQENIKDNGKPAPDLRLKTEAATPTQFCIAESKFSILGRKNCTEQSYVSVNFRPVPDDSDGQTLRLNDSDFGPASADGLRR